MSICSTDHHVVDDKHSIGIISLAAKDPGAIVKGNLDSKWINFSLETHLKLCDAELFCCVFYVVCVEVGL